MPSAEVEHMLELFRSEGYTVLAEELPEELPPREEREDRRATPEKLREGVREPEPPQYRPPKVPVLVDGSNVDPEELKGHEAPLHFVIEPTEGTHSQLHAFEDEARAVERAIELSPAESKGPHDPDGFFGSHIRPYHTAYLYEHIHRGGGRLSIHDGHAYWDLREQWLDGILWWWRSWNDQISSVTTSGRGLVLYEHIHWQGWSIRVPRQTAVLNLTDFGWNDRVSSMRMDYY